jgi:hypothetical protein
MCWHPTRAATATPRDGAADYDADLRPFGLLNLARGSVGLVARAGPQASGLHRPFALAGWTAEALAHLPEYCVMDRDKGMAQTVAAQMPSPTPAAAGTWLTEAELAAYAAEYGRTGFQGGLHWYRCSTHPPCVAELQLFAGRTIDVPALFIFIAGAGHWVRQEPPAVASRPLIEFLARHAPAATAPA